LETGSFFNKKANNIFLVACIVYYLLQVVALLYTHDMEAGLKHLQVKSALLVVPLALCLSSYPDEATRNRMMKSYVWILAAAMLFCLAVALKRFFVDHEPESIFFYHALVSPFEGHAIMFSILVFTGLAWLLVSARRKNYIVSYPVHLLLVVFFLFFLLLLSSKLVISFAALSLAVFVALMIKRRAASRFATILVVLGCVLLTGGALLTKNHISARFSEIVSQDMDTYKKENFNPGTAFNGLQFRLLHWRFVYQILNENNAWLKGVSPGDAQSYIDKKYVEKDMYTGNGTTSRGFLGYDTHNEFLESVLQTGIPGLLVFIIMCFGLLQLAGRTKDPLLWAVTLLLLAYTFNESVLETQYGLMLFLFLPLFFYQPRASQKPVE
ncbi:MAG: O-antigen ligase family protein, partial [Bacteroidetes bacterium]|nr:O-antigen ligase family protein [Bacteroidota bacterium]